MWSIIRNEYGTNDDEGYWTDEPRIIRRGMGRASAEAVMSAYHELATGPRNCQIVLDEWASRIIARWHGQRAKEREEWAKRPILDAIGSQCRGLEELMESQMTYSMFGATDPRYRAIITGIHL